MPVEAVFLLGIGDGLVAHELLQHVQIHSHAVLALGNEFREEGLELGKILGDKVGRLRLGTVSIDSLHIIIQ